MHNHSFILGLIQLLWSAFEHYVSKQFDMIVPTIFSIGSCSKQFIIIIIIIVLHHQHGYPCPFLATFSMVHCYIPYRHRAVVLAGRPAFARPCEGVHWSTSLMSSSLLLQQCPTCLVRLTWIIFVIGGKWP